MKKTLTVKEVADLCAVTPSTVQYWERKGAIKSFKTFGGHRRFEADAVEQFLAERGRGSASITVATEKRAEPRFAVSFPVLIFVEGLTACTASGNLSNLSNSGCCIEFASSCCNNLTSIEEKLFNNEVKIERGEGCQTINSPMAGQIRNIRLLDQKTIRVGVSLN